MDRPGHNRRLAAIVAAAVVTAAIGAVWLMMLPLQISHNYGRTATSFWRDLGRFGEGVQEAATDASGAVAESARRFGDSVRSGFDGSASAPPVEEGGVSRFGAELERLTAASAAAVIEE